MENPANLEFIRRRLLALVASSALPLPNPRRWALLESCRRAVDASDLLDMVLEAVSDSSHLPADLKDRVVEGLLTGDWEAVQTLVQGNVVRTASRLPPTGDVFLDFRRMAISIFYASRKIQRLPLALRRRIGSAILVSNTREELVDLFLTSLQAASTLDDEARHLIANDVFEGRYYRLLRADRFDCERDADPSTASDTEGIRVREAVPVPPATVVAPTPGMEVEHVWIDEDTTNECPVCLSCLTYPTTLTCDHVFCRGCLVDWSRNGARESHRGGTRIDQVDFQVSCPLCRQPGAIQSARTAGASST
jgi:hypothetical protein